MISTCVLSMREQFNGLARLPPADQVRNVRDACACEALGRVKHNPRPFLAVSRSPYPVRLWVSASVLRLPLRRVSDLATPPPAQVWVIEQRLHEYFADRPDRLRCYGAHHTARAFARVSQRVVDMWLAPSLVHGWLESAHATNGLQGVVPLERSHLLIRRRIVEEEEVAIGYEEPQSLAQVPVVSTDPVERELCMGGFVWFE